jgi:hypothetical protein
MLSFVFGMSFVVGVEAVVESLEWERQRRMSVSVRMSVGVVGVFGSTVLLDGGAEL